VRVLRKEGKTAAEKIGGANMSNNSATRPQYRLFEDKQ
jgi:hypothetical protein